VPDGARGAAAAAIEERKIASAMDVTLTDPLVGRVLDGRYRLESRVARGGMASVYAATDLRLERPVAVKIMHAALADDEEFVARFIREARAAASLSHPNVVAVYDQGADGDAVYLVMEYVAGHTVRDLLRRRGRLDYGEALALAEPILAALAAAHDAGLVHRDIKPENVLLAADGRVKVADFGLARAIASSTLTGTAGPVIGTIAYLSPEQVQRGAADARSDVYAAGVLMYELLTGETPFRGENAVAVAYRHVHEDVPAPSGVVPAVPAAVDRLVLWATRRNPAERPVDAGALLVAVAAARDELGSGEPVPRLPQSTPLTTAPLPDELPAGPPPVLPRPITAAVPPQAEAGTAGPVALRRRRIWPFVLLLVLAAAVAAGILGWWYGDGRYTTAPTLRDMSYPKALAVARAAGLRLRRAPSAYSDTVPAGEVVTQRPAPRSRVVEGSWVTVTISRGVLRLPVPPVAGSSVPAATSRLRSATFRVATVEHVHSKTAPAGQVIGTAPKAGTVLRHGSAVRLIVSSGPPPVPVPSVLDLTPEQAAQRLNAAGLRFTDAGSAFSSTVPRGEVMAENPGPKVMVSPGSTVSVTVSKGPQLVRVPRVVGDSLKRAETTLRGLGLLPRVERFPAGPGLVVAESPSPGTMRPRGSTVTLIVF
jgi:beta-lactam-binding protein with PASTA domain